MLSGVSAFPGRRQLVKQTTRRDRANASRRLLWPQQRGRNHRDAVGPSVRVVTGGDDDGVEKLVSDLFGQPCEVSGGACVWG
jgi:hypothetical protein